MPTWFIWPYRWNLHNTFNLHYAVVPAFPISFCIRIDETSRYLLEGRGVRRFLLNPPRPAWEGWVQDLARSLCFVLGQSSFLFSLGSINGYRRIVREAWWNARGVTLRWTDIPSGGGIVISRPVPIVLGNFWASFYFFYIHKGVDTASLVDWESCKSFLMLQRCADLLQRMFSLPMKCNMNCS